MAIQKRHRGTLGDLSGMEAPDLSFSEPAIQEPKPIEQPVPASLPETEVAVAAEKPEPATDTITVAVAKTEPAANQAAVQEQPRRGRPKGIKGAGPKRLNLIQGDKDKVLALQLPSKLIDGLRRYADEHEMTIKELVGKTLMKKIGPEYYK